MEAYKNKSGAAGVKAYELLENGIKIRFRDGAIYLYTYKSCGKKCVAAMKRLAVEGVGLTTYINQEVRERYQEKIG